eukprot:TRINITY_DN3105_c0_g1_i3.p1 TRINITY_DN3105_c0_g1~~TRINITY_DN3105_c0_g1_i3.p1  ORF type:complete len:307 (+),score=52.70 TRINITY_DN3105_c0_g1_i3:85-1005(+)
MNAQCILNTITWLSIITLTITVSSTEMHFMYYTNGTIDLYAFHLETGSCMLVSDYDTTLRDVVPQIGGVVYSIEMDEVYVSPGDDRLYTFSFESGWRYLYWGRDHLSGVTYLHPNVVFQRTGDRQIATVDPQNDLLKVVGDIKWDCEASVLGGLVREEDGRQIYYSLVVGYQNWPMFLRVDLDNPREQNWGLVEPWGGKNLFSPMFYRSTNEILILSADFNPGYRDANVEIQSIDKDGHMSGLIGVGSLDVQYNPFMTSYGDKIYVLMDSYVLEVSIQDNSVHKQFNLCPTLQNMNSGTLMGIFTR